MKSFVSALALVFVSATASAELLTLTAGTTSKKGVNISASAVAKVGGQEFNLTTVGSGVRTKTVVVLPIDVYVAQFMVSDASRFVKTDSGALPSLQAINQVAIRLTFLREVDAATIMGNFKTSLEKNNVNLQDQAIASFLSAVSNGGAAASGGSMTIFVTRNPDGSETVTFENAGKASNPITGQDLRNKIMSIWFGVVAFDNGLVKLKADLLK